MTAEPFATINALTEQLAALAERLDQLERLTISQRAEIERLRAAPVAPPADRPTPPALVVEAAPVADPASSSVEYTSGGGKSRRALLKLGGAAAAAGVAAMAASAAELAHPGTAHATTTTWTTGYFGVDTFTSVSGGNSFIYSSPLRLYSGGSSTGYSTLTLTTPMQAGLEAYDSNGNAMGVYATSSAGQGAHGETDSGYGVVGKANGSGVGVRGTSSSGYGVWGNTTSGYAGVIGYSNNATNGLYGTSASGVGVVAQSTSHYGGFFVGGLAPIFLSPGTGAGAPTSGGHAAGELYVDGAGVLWYCTANGTPGTWVRLTGVGSGTSGGAIHYLSAPVRLLDARIDSTSGVINRGPLAATELFDFPVAGLLGSTIPASAQGLIANVTVLGPSGTGNLSLFPAGGAIPTVASMTFGTPGLFLANGVNVAIGTGGQITIQNQSGGTTPMVLDAVAYVS
jgi:hypothetical protein